MVGAAFGSEEGPTVVELVGALDASGRTELSLVAEIGGAVAGHVQLSHGWVDARRALVDVLVLSPLSVDPAHQGQGIGGLLVAAAVESARGVRIACGVPRGRARLLRASWFRAGQCPGVHPPVAEDPRPGVPGGASWRRTRSG